MIIMLYKLVLKLSLDEINATVEERFPVVLFIMLYKVVPTFEPMNEIQSATISWKWKPLSHVLLKKKLFKTVVQMLTIFLPQYVQNIE